MIGVTGICAALLLSAALGGQDSAVNQDADILAALHKRMQDYVELHRALEAKLPVLSSDATPRDIDTHQRALGLLIQKSRRNAKRGDIFGPAARALIRRALSRMLSGPDGAQLKAAIREEDPGRLRVHVNGRYPAAAPRSTVPPQILKMLPRLPDALEYRFMAGRLLLVDARTQIIVDYIEDALPD